MARLTLAPMLATTGTVLPEGPLWTYEVKWDGYRALALKDGSRVQLLSRKPEHRRPLIGPASLPLMSFQLEHLAAADPLRVVRVRDLHQHAEQPSVSDNRHDF